MVFADSLTKAGRLMELQMIFATRPYRAHSTRELAGRLGIAVRTVRNYLTELSVSGRLPIIQEKKRWRLAPTRGSRRRPSASCSRRRPPSTSPPASSAGTATSLTRPSAPASASSPPSCRGPRRRHAGAGRARR